MSPKVGLLGPAVLLGALYLSSICVHGEPKPGVENVCNSTVNKKIERRVTEPVEVSLPYKSYCGIVPCTKHRKELRYDTSVKVFYEEVQVATCCQGYAETPNRECAPICLDPCRNGKCVGPNRCKCTPEPTEKTPGYLGHSCSQYACLASDRWGPNCDLECDCPLSAYCHASSGKCICKTGWRGADCSEPCKQGDSDCPDSDLIPNFDLNPDVNAIPSERLERLEAISPRGLNFEGEPETSSSASYSSFFIANLGLNLVLAMSTFFLILSVFWYRRRLNQIQNELYYAPSSSGSGSSAYSIRTARRTSGSPAKAASTSIHKPWPPLPPMPLPGPVEFFRKNLTLGRDQYGDAHLKSSSPNNDQTANFVLNPKLESRLFDGHRKAEPNFYSEQPKISTQLPDDQGSQYIPILEQMDSTSKIHLLSVNTSISSTDDSHYQVPKSPAPSKANTSCSSDDYSSPHNITQETNIYEEIKPKLPDRNYTHQDHD